MSVIIRDSSDNSTRVEVVYCPPGSLQARKLLVPKKEFLEACSEYADSISTAAGRPG